MAINDVFNSLEFDGVNSLSNDVFITGEAVYDAPERDVEMIEIPGRNGDFQLDNGRWKNIEVSYKAGVFGSDQNEFATKIRNYRNLLASRIGYKRLTDTYNPDEYRLGTFVNALEAKSASRKRAGEFDIVFNCKPQRFLTSGETEVTVTSGGTITNPTQYDSSPMLEVWGSGHMNVNGYDIELVDQEVGHLDLSNGHSPTQTSPFTLRFVSDEYNTGDVITARNVKFTWSVSAASGYEFGAITDRTDTNGAVSTAMMSTKKIEVTTTASLTFTAGTGARRTPTTSITVTLKNTSSGTTTSKTITLAGDINYSTNYNGSLSIDSTLTVPTNVKRGSVVSSCGLISVESTKSILGTPTYLDCDLGEAYRIKSGNVISLNHRIDLGSDLPVLSPGTNNVTFDNTVTMLKIVPRWWVL